MALTLDEIRERARARFILSRDESLLRFLRNMNDLHAVYKRGDMSNASMVNEAHYQAVMLRDAVLDAQARHDEYIEDLLDREYPPSD